MCINIENSYQTFIKIQKLFELNIPEETLNFLLCNTQDLELLYIALEIKLGFITDNLQSSINFPVDEIIKQTSCDNVEDVCKVLKLALLVQSDDYQFKIALEVIETNLKNERNEVKLLNTLKLLQFLITFDLEKATFSIDTFCDILFYNSKCVTNFLNVFIFPKLLESNTCRNQIFNIIWKSTQQTRDLTSFCALSNAFDKTFDFFKCDKFWFLLQECLYLKDFQKQAIHLLKKSLQALQHEESFNTKSRIISWDSHTKNDFDIAWVNYFILIEVLKEKQLHLVEPSYQLLPSIQILHSSWLLIVYKSLLTHTHNSVRAYAIVNVLKCNWWDESQDMYRDLIRILLPALNYNDNVSKSEVWEELCSFSSKLKDDYFMMLLEETIGIIWLPSVCYLFYFSILSDCHWINSVLIEKLLNSVEKLPNKFLRNSCIDVIRNSFLKHEFNFKDYLDVSWNFYKYNSFVVEESEALKYSKDVKLMIEAWCSKDLINVKHTAIVLQMLQLPSLNNELLQLRNSFLLKEISPEISDEVALLLCQKNLIVRELPAYIDERLISQNCDKKVKRILPFLKKCKQKDLLSLYGTCLEIIKCQEPTNLQVAYEVASIILEHTDTSLQQTQFYDNWKKEFFQNSQNINITFFIKSYFNERLQIWSDAIVILERAMEIHNHEILPEISLQLRNLLNASSYCAEIERFIDICLKTIIESKRTDCFKPAILNFISSLFDNNKISNDLEFLNKVLCITSKALDLAKLYEDIAYNVAHNLDVTLTKNHHLVVHFIPTLVDLLLFGDILKSDQRAEYLVCQKIYQDGQKPNNPNFRRLSILGQTVNTVNNLLCNKSIDLELKSKWADQMTSLLMDKYMLYFGKRYFADSMIHLQKLRTLQAFLLVQRHITKKKNSLTDLLMNALCSESHQSSVKFLIQWLLIELLHENNNCTTLIESKMDHASKVQPSTIIAFVPILYHLALTTNDEQFWFNLFKIILPWTMGPHFNLRLYAQEGLLCIYEQAENRNLTNLVTIFKSCIECIKSVINKSERTLNPVDKFVFYQFNSEKFYNLYTIYISIPRLTNVSNDVYENFNNIKAFPCNPNEINLPIMTPSKVTRVNKEQFRTGVIQKKAIPWTSLFENEIKKPQPNQLIVVASLVDKVTNLGGISRTCEVFGVKQLAFHSISSVKEDDFRSLSMSSENWIDIIEVKIDDLRTFLLKMKEKHYVVVGAEQTSNSAKLNTFNFPKKCLLVLGNEKEGISPYILPLIDFCVEIPQFGVVRSLNVHVAAATFIWEYTKQHAISL